MRTREKLLIIDGYNVLRSGSRYKSLLESYEDYTKETFNTIREKLIGDVVNFAGMSTRAIVVFDAAYGGHKSTNVERIGCVEVMFTAEGKSADSLIERLCHNAREHGIETLVVTSDASIQDTVFGGGVDRMSAEGFCQEVALSNFSDESESAMEPKRKSTIADRIDPDMAERLKSIRDGLSEK